MTAKFWKIGQLAKRTGLSVRTLHFYDEIGLLKPRHRSNADHRLYGEDDIARLQQIVSLRDLGFALEDIRGCLDDPAFSPARAITMQLARLREQIGREQRLCERLAAVAARLEAAEAVSAETFLQTIEAITMFEKYFNAEQREKISRRAEQLGPERIREGEAAWPQLIAEVRAEMGRGTDPADPRVQALAARWRSLVEAFTGGDKGIAKSLGEMYRNEGENIRRERGASVPDPEVFAYIRQAFAAGGTSCA